MKIHQLLCGMSAMLMAGCSAELTQEQPPTALVPIAVHVGDGMTTRASMEVQESQFDAGETFLVSFSSGSVVLADGRPLVSTMFTTDGKGATTPVDQPFFEASATETTVKDYYPHSVNTGTTVFTVQQDQRSDEQFKQSDLMYATTTAAKSGTSVDIPLQFEHRLAKLTVLAVAVDSVETLYGISLVGGYRGIDIANPSTCALGSTLSSPVSEGEPLQVWDSETGSSIVFASVMLPPQTIEGDFIRFNTDDGIYSYRLNKSLQGGHEYIVALRIGAATPVVGEVSGRNPMFVSPIPDYTYTGEEIRPEIEVRNFEGNVLTPDTDYMVVYSNAVNVGVGMVIVVGMGDYAGSFTTAPFNICQAAGSIAFDLSEVEVTWWPDTYYNGNTLTVVGDSEVTYTSSNESVATVDATGKVTLLTDGTTTITAHVADTRNWHYETKEASYTLTILPRSEIDPNGTIDPWADPNGGGNSGTVDY